MNFRFFTLASLVTSLLLCLQSNAQDLTDWTTLNLDTPVGWRVYATSVVNENVVWGTMAGDMASDRFFRTTDGGQTFQVGTMPFRTTRGVAFAISAVDENTAFTASTTGSGEQVEGIHRTRDGGATWDLVFNNFENNVFTTNVHFFNALEGVAYAFGTTTFSAVFYKTTDGGFSWEKSEDEFSVGSVWTEGGNSGMTAVGDTVWCCAVADQIFRSVGGSSWEAFSTGTSRRMINDIAFKDGKNGLAISSQEPDASDPFTTLVLHTDDGGETWTETTLPFGTFVLDANSIEYIPGTGGSYIITSGDSPTNSEFAVTTDNGMTWERFKAPSDLTCVEFVSPTVGFGGTFTSLGGLLKYNDDLFTGDIVGSKNPEIVKDIRLYPNPTSDFVTLQFENFQNKDIGLRLIDAKGQPVLSVADFAISGINTRQLDLSSLPAGIYELIITDNRHSVSKKIIRTEN